MGISEDWRAKDHHAVEAAIRVLEEVPCSLRELAKAAGLSAAALSRYRSGQRTMRLFHAMRVLDAIEIIGERYTANAERCEALAGPLREAVEQSLGGYGGTR